MNTGVCHMLFIYLWDMTNDTDYCLNVKTILHFRGKFHLIVAMDWKVCGPQIHRMLSPRPQCFGIWRWGLWEIIRFRLGHEGWNLMMELVPLYEEEISLHPLSLPMSMHQGNAMGPHSEKVIVYKLGSGPSSEMESEGNLIFNFPASRLWEINSCCLSHQVA